MKKSSRRRRRASSQVAALTPGFSLTAPVLRFNSNLNSQLLAVLEDF